MKQEAGDGARLVESLNYNPLGLRNTYRYFLNHPDESERYGRTSEHPADPGSIANLAYADRNGNGDAESGDGWTYRGRGLFQLTGRGNYRLFTDWHESTFGEGIDFEADPALAAEPCLCGQVSNLLLDFALCPKCLCRFRCRKAIIATPQSSF